MNLSEALQSVRTRARTFEEQRRLLLHAAVEAHMDHGLGANTIATNLGAYAGGPGWGRDRVLEILRAARTARAANNALGKADLAKVVQAIYTEPRSADDIPLSVPDTVARLAVLTGAHIGVGGAKAILAVLNTAGLTVASDDAESALAESSKNTPPLHLKPIPRPLTRHENGDDVTSDFGGDGTPEEQADRIAAQRDALIDLGRVLQPAAGHMMTLEAARHTSAYLELHEGLFYFNQLNQSRRADVLDLVQSYPLDAPFSFNGSAEEDVEYLEHPVAGRSRRRPQAVGVGDSSPGGRRDAAPGSPTPPAITHGHFRANETRNTGHSINGHGQSQIPCVLDAPVGLGTPELFRNQNRGRRFCGRNVCVRESFN